MSQTPAALLAAATPAELPAVATLLVLSELARSDDDFDRRERQSIQRALSSIFDLDSARVSDLMNEQEDIRKGAADLAGLSRLLTHRLPQTRERMAVVTAMWTVVLADGKVTSLEDRLASSRDRKHQGHRCFIQPLHSSLNPPAGSLGRRHRPAEGRRPSPPRPRRRGTPR